MGIKRIPHGYTSKDEQYCERFREITLIRVEALPRIAGCVLWAVRCALFVSLSEKFSLTTGSIPAPRGEVECRDLRHRVMQYHLI